MTATTVELANQDAVVVSSPYDDAEEKKCHRIVAALTEDEKEGAAKASSYRYFCHVQARHVHFRNERFVCQKNCSSNPRCRKG
jgi:hypothetical protein